MTRILLLSIALLLSACSSIQSPPTAPDANLQGKLDNDWQFSGKAGIRQGNSADSANIDWHQQDQAYEVRLSGPLGQGGAVISGDSNSVEMQVSGESETYRGRTPEEVMYQALGWYLPVSQARYWVQGLPDPAYPSTPLSDASGFEQLGWRVEIQRLTEVNPDLILPGRLEFTYQDLRLRLVIRDWQP
ncbi:lipoprotein insertase outer membrane protein LolB [Marinobacterium lutimaris]|uniref:Outer-membrane lipoprotein LolB n=1 Tax=Marinobacterium lutimaris TaxID=568106 RepID=A0A1H6CSK8_9GAMM|nr:lipoprotein insertase outer membrane protein LolB [Marinobacterium lutimaris]SEG75992.1 outer membrane lipoprotein LolB [Marinobacterium lutimaris]